MGRRFKRLRRLSQQVVKITRRVFTLCLCGQVTKGIEEEIVPVRSLLNRCVNSPKRRTSRPITPGYHVDRKKQSSTTCSQKECGHPPRSEATRDRPIPEGEVDAPTHKIIPVAPYKGQASAVVHSPSDNGEEENPTEPLPRLHFLSTNKWARVLPTDIQVRQLIHRSNFGEVEIVRRPRMCKGRFIMKTIRSNTGLEEANLLIKCQSQFVVKLFACYTTAKITYLYMPCYKLRDVQYWLLLDRRRQLFTEQMVGWVMIHLLLAIEYIHNQDVLHLDIKPANIFLTQNGYPILGDFGGAVTARPDATGVYFTMRYASPEVLRSKPVDRMADLWSAAATYFHLISRKQPIIRGKVKNGTSIKRLKILFDTSSLSPVAANFVKAQVRIKKNKRLGFLRGILEVLTHPVFAGTNWEEINRRFPADKSCLFHRLVELKLL